MSKIQFLLNYVNDIILIYYVKNITVFCYYFIFIRKLLETLSFQQLLELGTIFKIKQNL